jgi:hypothetical protein
MKTEKLITDGQSLTGATHDGHPLQTYDDGFGPLWVFINSLGLVGIIRALTWEDAWGIAEDEMFPEADETTESILTHYNYTERHAKMIKPADGGEVREALPEDYPLEPGQFVRWDTVRVEPEEGEEVWMENAQFQDAFGFRPNGRNERDTIGHGIYAKDLNGESLERLTASQLASWGIVLEIVAEEV